MKIKFSFLFILLFYLSLQQISAQEHQNQAILDKAL